MQGISHAIHHAPKYYNLIIEVDDGRCASLVNGCAHARANKYDKPELPLVMDILDYIEIRNKRGDYFVDVIDSSKDPTAKRGLALARK